MNLLSYGNTNSKTKKNSDITYILYIAPHTNNDKGINLCPRSTPECVSSCLFNSGYSEIHPRINEHRRRKANLYVSNRIGFLTLLKEDIETAIRRAKDRRVLFRLNGTSDIDFLQQLKTVGFDYSLTPDNVGFYDYTKILGKIKKYRDTKYILTFSYSGSNADECKTALSYGANVSMVYKTNIPETFLNTATINGDTSDDVMYQHRSMVLALKLKGNKNRKHSSSFILEN